jgi:riboflavin kinase/FMN adenylyltransferase
MHVINWNDFITQDSPQKGMSATIGVFDGVHLGHQSLIKKITDKKDVIPTIFTFIENPKAVMKPESFQGNIITLKQKLELFESFNISQVVLIDFSGNFSKLKGREFIDLLRIRGSLRYLAIGSNFRCGYKLDTDSSLIKAMNAVHGIPTDVMNPITACDEFISSSRIRNAILSGDLVEARTLCGRNVKIDVSGISKTPGDGEIIFNAAASTQITPPKGRYPVLVYEMNSTNEGIETEVFVENGNIHLPSKYNAELNGKLNSIEFVY